MEKNKIAEYSVKTITYFLLLLLLTGCSAGGNGSINTDPPSSPVRLVFVHHSCGSNWLADGLHSGLNTNNYYVSDMGYGWDAESGDGIGNRTDTGNWSEWFTNAKMPYVYARTGSSHVNAITDPGGQNTIIMFKSCYPNSEVGSDIGDEQAIYNSLLPYFAAHQEKLFILITPPGEADVSSYQLTRQLCDWLVDEKNGWLKDYPHKNVGVYDFYSTLSETNSHHRICDGVIEHVYSSVYDGSSPYHNSDDHPNAAGNGKAVDEYVPLLNYFYNRWKGFN
jgi:hypothetical protein